MCDLDEGFVDLNNLSVVLFSDEPPYGQVTQSKVVSSHSALNITPSIRLRAGGPGLGLPLGPINERVAFCCTHSISSSGSKGSALAELIWTSYPAAASKLGDSRRLQLE